MERSIVFFIGVGEIKLNFFVSLVFRRERVGEEGVEVLFVVLIGRNNLI